VKRKEGCIIVCLYRIGKKRRKEGRPGDVSHYLEEGRKKGEKNTTPEPAPVRSTLSVKTAGKRKYRVHLLSGMHGKGRESGMTANPGRGKVSDRLVVRGIKKKLGRWVDA